MLLLVWLQEQSQLGDLAIDNYYEMRDHVANESFKEKRKIEMSLEKNFPTQYSSKYSLVTFNENIGYHEAMTKGRIQDEVLIKLIESNEISECSDLEEVLDKVNQQTKVRLDN